MSKLLDPQRLNAFRTNGRLIAEIRQKLVDYAHTESSLEKIDALADKLISEAGGEPAFKKVRGYHWATCICLNDCLVHGIPKGQIKSGDLVTIDVGMYYQGTTTDVATTFVVGQSTPKLDNFLAIGHKTMREAIKQARGGQPIRAISEKLQSIPESAGFNVTRHLVGHGLGKTMHEPPAIPCYVSDDPNLDIKLIPGQVITIEAMYMMGDWHLTQAPDGWGLHTADGSLSAMFEEDILITDSEPEVLSTL